MIIIKSVSPIFCHASASVFFFKLSNHFEKMLFSFKLLCFCITSFFFIWKICIIIFVANIFSSHWTFIIFLLRSPHFASLFCFWISSTFQKFFKGEILRSSVSRFWSNVLVNYYLFLIICFSERYQLYNLFGGLCVKYSLVVSWNKKDMPKDKTRKDVRKEEHRLKT